MKHIILTGGSSGIGYEALKVLAAEPEVVVIVGSRTEPKDIPSNVHFHTLDLASQSSVRAFVEWYSFPPAEAFIACAGITAGQTEFVDGIELTFATNHVGHALLFFLLNGRGNLQRNARIIFVGSSLHDSESKSHFKPYWTTADAVAHAKEPEMQPPMVAYPNSKLANTLFSYALAKRAEKYTVNIYDPAFVPGGGSRLHRNAGAVAGVFVEWVVPYIGWLFRWQGIVTSTTAESGQALARLATDPSYDGVSGKMIRVNDEMKCSKQAAEPALQDDLWDWTVAYLKLSPKETTVQL